MRVVVIPTVEEQRATGDMDIILPEGVIFPPEPVPVSWDFSYDLNKIVGWASDFRLEDGRITAELSFDATVAGRARSIYDKTTQIFEPMSVGLVRPPSKPR